MAKIPPDAFKKVTAATGHGNSRPFERAGGYISRIDEVRHHDKRNGTFAICVDKTILKVLHKTPADELDGKHEVFRGHEVGEQVTDFIDFDKDYAPDAVASFLGRLFGVDPAEVTAEDTSTAVDEGQPCRGFIVETQNAARQVRNDESKWYARISYERVIPASDLAGILDAKGLEALRDDRG